MVPVVFVLSETLGTNPLYLALGNKKICYMKKHTCFMFYIWFAGVTITASYAFMLPVGTPYNAIVYDAGQVKNDFYT